VSVERSRSDDLELDVPGEIRVVLGQRDWGVPDWDDAIEKFDHLDCMAPLAIEKVETIANLSYGDGVFLGVVLEDQLFKVEKGTFVRYFLSDLDHGFPSILSSQLGAAGALAVLNQEFDLEGLFENCVGQCLKRYAHMCVCAYES
jgi:hypothetical protein